MLTLRPPSAGDIAAFVGRQQTAPFSYTPAGATCDRAPHGYVVDHNRVKLGAGERTFARAVDAVRRWEMFNIGWVTLCWPNVPIEADRTVAILIPLFGLWLLNACRIVYVLDGDGPSDGNIRRFGFAYGTLPDHMESGEERFSVEWRRDDGSVWYDLFAFSRPRHPLARLGGPFYSRALQRRFARDSLRAMARAVGP
ncbi:MAG: hypothetical protein AUF76_14270 [Acidobacteria bacterium 13_1_20CM_2_65_9]|nr:MAG: hypothetical protein AUF76_14270 [Acidobacteria bacterium 13_1_20CM_2_65_9]